MERERERGGEEKEKRESWRDGGRCRAERATLGSPLHPGAPISGLPSHRHKRPIDMRHQMGRASDKGIRAFTRTVRVFCALYITGTIWPPNGTHLPPA